MHTFVRAGDDAGVNRKIWSSGNKIAIVMESFTTNIGVAEMCRKYNLSPRVFYSWKEKFLEGGKQALSAHKSITQTSYSKKMSTSKRWPVRSPLPTLF